MNEAKLLLLTDNFMVCTEQNKYTFTIISLISYHIYIYIYIYIHTCMCVCVCVFIYIYTAV